MTWVRDSSVNLSSKSVGAKLSRDLMWGESPLKFWNWDSKIEPLVFSLEEVTLSR
jgi:hypothetical protein